MLARLFLFKVLSFLKSSRLVFATIFIFGSACVLAVEAQINSLIKKTPKILKNNHYVGHCPAKTPCAKPAPMPSSNMLLRRPAIYRSRTHPL